jgi:hypothetical protein
VGAPCRSIDGSRHFKWWSAIAGEWLRGYWLHRYVFIVGPRSYRRCGLNLGKGMRTFRNDMTIIRALQTVINSDT